MLAADAAAAQAFGLPHGVSTRLVSRVSPSLLRSGRVAPLAVVLTQFEARQTGEHKWHYTVILPDPVTIEVAGQVNAIFSPR